MYKYLLLILMIVSCEDNNSIKNSSNNQETIDYDFFRSQKDVNIDSLYQIVVNTKNDTIKVNDLISIFRLSIRNKPIRTDVLDEALEISKEIDYQTGIGNCLSKKGVNARYEHQYLKSLKFHKEALPYFKNSWDIKARIRNLNALGVTYRRLNLEEQAVKFHLEALELSEKNNFVKSAAIALNGTGNAYISLKKYDDAIKYFRLALKWHKLDDNERGVGYDYSNMGEAFMYKQQYDSSFYYQSKALEIANKSKNINDIAIIQSAMGLMFQKEQEWQKALEYYFKSIPVLEKNQNKRLLSFTLINTGIIYTELQDFNKAKSYIDSGLQLSSEILSKDNLVLGYKALSDLLELDGQYGESLANYKSMVVYRDSIFNIQSDNNIVAMNIKFDSDKKDEKINRLNLEREINKDRNIILFLSLGLLFVISVFSFIFNRMKIKNNNMVIDHLRSQINGYLGQISHLEDKDVKSGGFNVSDKLSKYGLSTREKEVLDCIGQGMKNQEIADKMFVSLSTIKTHTQNIYDKLEVRNRIEAARKAQVI